MKLKIKPITPEKQRELDEIWEAVGKLRTSPISGMILTPEEYEQEQREHQAKREEWQRRLKEREIINSWKRLDFETLNTLLIQYKDTNDETYFNQAWDKYLKNLTYSYLNKYVIRGLPVSAKKLFLIDHQYYHLQDVLYPVLIKAIHQWTPNAQNRNTRDFAAYYKQAVKNLTGNIINRYNHKMYQNLSIQQLDFNNEEELTMLLQVEPTLKEHFENRANLDVIIMDKHIETFIKTQLTKEQSMLLGLLITERLPITEIAKYMKTSRMTVYRKIEELKTLWQQYEEGSN
ncbi:MAG: HTH domain-containing protein [Pelosinus sp.]|nr:HTH domain-containing protein [Pelosinus sp.]